jgi:hypothetical protein
MSDAIRRRWGLRVFNNGHGRCTDKMPCGPKCPHWEIKLSDDAQAKLAALGQEEAR